MKCDVNELKVKGITDECGIKNFEIRTPSGDIFIAIREGKKYTIGDDPTKRTLRECKLAVANDTVVFFADRCTKVVPDAQPEEAPEGTWDHVDANALLVLRGSSDVTEAEIRRTLDANGWLTPEGEPDVVAARENFSKWRKR